MTQSYGLITVPFIKNKPTEYIFVPLYIVFCKTGFITDDQYLFMLIYINIYFGILITSDLILLCALYSLRCYHREL
jgi:hypothetical protein